MDHEDKQAITINVSKVKERCKPCVCCAHWARLCLSVFPWVSPERRKGQEKLTRENTFPKINVALIDF